MQSSFDRQTEKEKLYAMFSDILSNGGTGDCQIGHESPCKISREFSYVVQNLLRDIQLLNDNSFTQGCSWQDVYLPEYCDQD